MEKWYRASWNMVLKALGTDLYNGVKPNEVEARRDKYGENIIRHDDKYIIFKFLRIIGQFWFVISILNGIILILNDQIGAGTIILLCSVIVLAAQLVSYIKNYKSIKNITSMDDYIVKSTRDGFTCKLTASELVVGDIVYLMKGDVVPADMRIIESDHLKVREGTITGVVDIVEKYSTKIDEEIYSLSNMKNMLFKSTTIAEGNCIAVVVATGMSTQAAGLLEGLSKLHDIEFELINYYKQIFNIHTLLIAVSSMFIALASFSKPIRRFSFMFTSGTILNLILICIMFILVVKTYINNQEIDLMSLSNILKITRMNSVIVDTYGTLSENVAHVKLIYSDGILRDTSKNNLEFDSNIKRTLQTIMMSKSPVKTNEFGSYINVIDKSMLDFAFKFDTFTTGDKEHKLLFNLPYDNERRMMTTVYKVDENYRSYTKGSMDSVIKECTHIMKKGLEVEASKEEMEAIKNIAIKMESQGYYVVATAYRSFYYEPSISEKVESNMVFVSLVALENPLKEKAPNYIKRLRRLGISPIFITEDTKLSAYAWATRIGLINSFEELLSGVEIDNMGREEFVNISKKVRLYSRLSPANKASLISALKENGLLTAFTVSSNADLMPAVNSNMNIIYGSKPKGLMKTIGSANIRENLLENLANLVVNCKIFIGRLNNAVMFTISSLVVMFLLSSYVAYFNSSFQQEYSKVFWINFFNLPFMISIILMDVLKESTIPEDEEDSKSRTILKSYLSAVVITALIAVISGIFSIFLENGIDYYLVWNIVQIIFVNHFRIKERKLMSFSNLLYLALILFNVALIIFINF